MSNGHIFGDLVLLFARRRSLEQLAERWLLGSFFIRAQRTEFYKSGRSALVAVFDALAKVSPNGDVLVPDYVCNVVPRAVAVAGLRPVEYQTNEAYGVDWNDLEPRLQHPGVVAVVLASLFGAQNTSQEVVARIRRVRKDVLIVLDDCQNMVLANPIELDERTVVVFSFNMKTIAGAMGGGVCLGGGALAVRAPKCQWLRDTRLEIAVALVLAKQLTGRVGARLRRLFGQPVNCPPKLEYSYAAGRVHYDMRIQRIAHVSLIRAITGMRRAAATEATRKRNFEALRAYLGAAGAGEVLPTTYPERAPFVPIKVRDLALLRHLPLKGPYALEGHPNQSSRPEAVCVVNQGLEPLALRV